MSIKLKTDTLTVSDTRAIGMMPRDGGLITPRELTTKIRANEEEFGIAKRVHSAAASDYKYGYEKLRRLMLLGFAEKVQYRGADHYHLTPKGIRYLNRK